MRAVLAVAVCMAVLLAWMLVARQAPPEVPGERGTPAEAAAGAGRAPARPALRGGGSASERRGAPPAAKGAAAVAREGAAPAVARGAVPSPRQRLARVAQARTVAEVVALLDERERHPGWREDVERMRAWFTGVLANERQALRRHLEDADPTDELARLEELSLRCAMLRTQTRLDALRRGHFYVGRVPRSRIGPWQLCGWRGIVDVHRADADPALRQLERELSAGEEQAFAVR